LFADRWLDEGLAQEYATRAVAELQQPRPDPTAVSATTPGAFALNEWGSPKFQDQNSVDREDFGYNAAWSVMRSIVDEVGIPNMQKVFAAATNHTIAYTGNGAPETFVGATDWRRFLDDVDNLARSTKADALFATTVATPSQQSMLMQRAAAR